MDLGARPYLYDSDRRDSRLPEKEFDPKAVTRASWEPKPSKKPKKDGPLVSFNRHPDAHEVPTGRSTRFRPMSDSTKWFIKWTRHLQLALRVLEMIAGVGLLALMILISEVDPLTAWVMRITPGVVAISCVYAIWHLSRPARSRTPASSAAYHLFASFTDLAVLPLYAFGGISVINHGTEWATILSTKEFPTVLPTLVSAEYYAIISAGCVHVVSLCISLWLGLTFRRISNMPPDMNPLEDHLTSRVKHKRNKSSVASGYTTVSENSKRLSDPLEKHRRSGAPYEELSRPPSIPFMHTRTGSKESFSSSNRDSRGDLPSRQYQIQPTNSPRNSAGSLADLKRSSTPRSAQRGNYTEIPLHETGAPSSRPNSAVISPINASPTRIAKFTEAWYASESLIERTQQRQRAMKVAEKTRQYESLNQRYDVDSDSDQENGMMRPDAADFSDLDDDEGDRSSPINAMRHMHPNPLRSHPTPPPPTPPKGRTGGGAIPREKTPFRPRESVLSEVSLNSRSPSGSQDIADEKPALGRRPTLLERWGGGGMSGKGRNRNSSIQPEEHFYSKPYGALKPATPPIMIGSERQVSSGNDYGNAKGYGRRNVSGKVAEEGLAGPREGYSRYSILNE